MGIRTNPTDVADELGFNFDPSLGKELTRWIAKASLVIDRVVTCASRKGITLTSTEQAHMEASIAAHFYTKMDPLYSSRSTLSTSGSMTRTADDYLNMSLAIDPSGCLAAHMKGQRAGATWMGRIPSEQVPYHQRD